MASIQPSPMTIKRIHREIADLKKEDLGDITLAPVGDNIYDFKGTIPGPQGSIYEGGVFNVDVHLPADYPFNAPKVLFRTRIYHMNIAETGSVCLDILKHNWSPALSLFKVMLSLSSLLTDPNPQDPLVPPIAQEYVRNRKKHDATAKRWTELYARPPPPPPQPVSSKGKRKTDTLINISDSEDDGSVRRTKRVKKSMPVNEVLDITGDGEIVVVEGSSSRRPSRTRPAPSSKRPTSREVIPVEDD